MSISENDSKYPLATGFIYREYAYMGTVIKVEDYGPMLYRHAIENGLEDAGAVIFLGEGAR